MPPSNESEARIDAVLPDIPKWADMGKSTILPVINARQVNKNPLASIKLSTFNNFEIRCLRYTRRGIYS